MVYALSHWSKTRCRKERGYSLLELVIAISIIAILAVLLTSLASSFTENSRGTQCMSNLRQLSVALQLYRGDNRNTLPPFREYFPQPDGSTINGTSWRGLLIPYLPGVPFDNQKSRKALDSCPSGWRADAPNIYTYYYAMTTDSTSAARKNCSTVASPGRYFVLGDSTGEMRINPRKNSDELAFRHRGKAHLLFLDGHIEKRLPKEIPPVSQEESLEYKAFWTGQ